MRIAEAFGIIDLSPIELSELFTKLKISHGYLGRIRNHTSYRVVDGLCAQQPAWPIILDDLSLIRRGCIEQVNILFVIASRAELSHCNLSTRLWPENRELDPLKTLKQSLLDVDLSKSWSLKNTQPSIQQYVNAATKESFLNHVQTALYKITPYALRKETQEKCIAYLAGHLSMHQLKMKLNSSYKLDNLSQLMLSPKAKALRDAVIQLKHESVEQVAKTSGFEPFELRYISLSFQKTNSKR